MPELIRFVDAPPATSTGKVQTRPLRQQVQRIADEAWAQDGA